jgi:phage shock protein A
MSGQNGAHDAGDDDAARLDAALDRIARAAAQAQRAAEAAAAQNTGLHRDAPNATTGPDTAEVADRLDALIAELRGVLGTQGA